MDDADDLSVRLGRLAEGIDVPSSPPTASLAVSPATSRGLVRRRALVVAAAVVLLVGAGAVVWAASGDRPTQVTAGPGERPGPSIDDSTPAGALARILADDGVDLDRVPSGLLDGEFQVCGPQRNVVAEAARCFLDAHLARIPAVVVDSTHTDEGDPIVTVHRTSAEGDYDYLVDATRDAFGSGRWERGTCDLVGYRGDRGLFVVPFDVDGCNETVQLGEGDAVPILGPMPAVPDWFGPREPLELCGVELSIDDGDPLGRLCFSNAAAAGEPAELVYVSTGDEGESVVLWYRSIGEGRVEVIERQIPDDGDPTGSTGGWRRYACTSAGIVDDPGAAANGLPTAHTGPGCSVVDEVPG